MGGEREKANMTLKVISKNGELIFPIVYIAGSLCKSHSGATPYKTSVGT